MFFVLLTGEGQGCDYCIDCNKTFKRLKAKTLEDAKDEVGKLCGYYGSIDKAKILEVISDVDFDVDEWKAIRKAKRDEKKRLEKLAADKVTFEKLKKQFE